MKVGSLFSGIGGIDLGLKWAGMETIWFVENDKYCQKVLAKHWPGVPCYGDIKTVDFGSLPRPELLCGGFPCQPVSVAGKRRGADDSRWLWPEMFKAIREIRPKFALLENVPGLLDRGFSSVLCDLASIRYDAEWETIPAAAFGAPHLRYRVYIVAYSSSDNGNIQVFKKTKREETQKQYSNICSIKREHIYRRLQRNEPKPRMVRMDDGISSIMDRLRCLGNAVVPQVAQWIGEQIMAYEATQ